MKKPMLLLAMFEEAGKKAEVEGRYLSWRVPLTNFLVVQHYTEGVVRKVWAQYGPPIGEKKSTGYFENTYQLAIVILEEQVMSKRKQGQGAAPNAIHSLDAAHLLLTIDACDFDTVTIHDSFGSLAADMEELFVIVREQFVRLHSEPILELMARDMEADIEVEEGTLNIESVLDSEYAFA